MPSAITEGQLVYVPTRFLPDSRRDSHAIRQCKVVEIVRRSVRVQLRNGEPSDLIAISKIHSDLGVALLSIGDFETEDGLINPLSKSLLQFCRLILPDDQMTTVRVRSITEVGSWWKINHAAFTHIIIVGHGCAEAIKFGVGGNRKAKSFHRQMHESGSYPKTFISLCCETGKSVFASNFSGYDFCSYFIGPEHSIHGAVASQFLQSFLNLHLLHGKSTKIAHRHANELVLAEERFCIWKSGQNVSDG